MRSLAWGNLTVSIFSLGIAELQTLVETHNCVLSFSAGGLFLLLLDLQESAAIPSE